MPALQQHLTWLNDLMWKGCNTSSVQPTCLSPGAWCSQPRQLCTCSVSPGRLPGLPNNVGS